MGVWECGSVGTREPGNQGVPVWLRSPVVSSKLLLVVWFVFAVVLFCALLFWESGSQFFERLTSMKLFVNRYLCLRLLLVPRKQNVVTPLTPLVLVGVVTVM